MSGKPNIKTVTKSVDELIENNEEAPLPLSVFPNSMGINLCNVESLTWTKEEDGQLRSLSVQFIPASKE